MAAVAFIFLFSARTDEAKKDDPAVTTNSKGTALVANAAAKRDGKRKSFVRRAACEPESPRETETGPASCPMGPVRHFPPSWPLRFGDGASPRANTMDTAENVERQ